jgi:glycosyltransferase involved in cell wall biosynthesis
MIGRMPDPAIVLQQLSAQPHWLRIAVVTETYPPEINGVALTIGHTVNALLQRGHQIQLIRPRQGHDDAPGNHENLEEVLKPGVKIPSYDGLKMGLPAKSALNRLWNLHRPDVVHIATEGPLGWSALAAANKLRLPVTTDFHTNFHSYSRHYGLGWMRQPIIAYLRKFHNKSQVTLVPTEGMRKELQTQGYDNVEVVGRGVDTRLFDPARRDVALRRSWGADEKTLAVLYVGRLAAEKNLPLLVDTFRSIQASVANSRLILVGDGPERERMLDEFPDSVHCGMRTGEDLAAHYASADLFLFPSLTETFGNVTLEAMASGLPVVAFDYAAGRDLIAHRENGWLAPYPDEKAFLAQALEAAQDGPIRNRVRTAARKTAETMNWQDIFNRFEFVLRREVAAQETRDERTGMAFESQ